MPTIPDEVLDSFLESLEADDLFSDDMIAELRIELTSSSKTKPADVEAIFTNDADGDEP